MAGRKRIDSAQQKIRLAEKEQKLYETQEYIQVYTLSLDLPIPLSTCKSLKFQPLDENSCHFFHPSLQLLQMKVTRLEHLVQIKDMKINELQRQLAFATSRHPLHKP